MRFNHKIWANSEIRTYALPKNGGTYPLVRPKLLKGGGGGGGSCPPLILRYWFAFTMGEIGWSRGGNSLF